MDATHIADQILPGSTALAGLLLVVLSNLGAAYDTHKPAPTAPVKAKFRWRARFVFLAFGAALSSALAAFAFYWCESEALIYLSAALFVIAALCSLVTAYQSASEIG